MAIIIPSKDIYEINNQKVIDNEVDNIEVKVKKAILDNHYSEPVHNEEITSGFDLETKSQVKSNSNVINSVVNPSNPAVQVYGCFVCVNNLYYISKDIFIPFRQDITHILKNIITGIDENGNENIHYSCYGKIINGTTNTMSIVVLLNSVGAAVESCYEIYAPPQDETGYNIKKEETGSYSIEYEQSSTFDDEQGHQIETKITIEKKDNLANAIGEEVVIDGEKYLKLSLSNILCGMRVIKGSGENTALRSAAYGDNRTLSTNIGLSKYIQYVPERVDITVYGNTIGINLQDETIKIGDGQHVYSFEGNELMQTSNTPTIENTFDRVMSSWKNGKEVAVLRCAIDDYSENDSGKTIVISKDGGSLPMTFHIGDTVIPYIKNAKNVDIPMSQNRDGTPKEFNIIGINMIFDGAVYQEITIQENQMLYN